MAISEATHILTVDVGNTTSRVGVFSIPPSAAGGVPELIGTCELTTRQPVTADEARIQLAQARALLPACEVSGAIMSCVVPSVGTSWLRALADLSPTRPLEVGPGLKTGLRMRYDDPAEVGGDRVADAVAACALYGGPAIVVDLGTTTNFEVVDANGVFVGGVIAPGIALGGRALAEAAARLPMVELRAPKRIIGTNTRAAMQSGVVLGEVARIDGLLDGIMAELGEPSRVVITGEGAGDISALLRHETTVDDALTLRGLAWIWRKNQR